MVSTSDIKSIVIRIRPHKEQRYETWGDYDMLDDSSLWIQLSEFDDPDIHFCVLIHELFELWECIKKGIPIDEITRFDLENLDSDDPGTLPHAPYHEEHMKAIELEKFLWKLMNKQGELYDEDNTEPKGVGIDE